MRGVIDRFEGEFAVVELDTREIKNIKREIIPKNAKEGDVLNIGENITIDYEEAEKRKKEIESMMEDLFEE